MLGSNPSAVPRAETEGPGHRPSVPPASRTLRDQQQCDKPTVQSSKRLHIDQPVPSRSRRTSTGYAIVVASILLMMNRIATYIVGNHARHRGATKA